MNSTAAAVPSPGPTILIRHLVFLQPIPKGQPHSKGPFAEAAKRVRPLSELRHAADYAEEPTKQSHTQSGRVFRPTIRQERLRGSPGENSEVTISKLSTRSRAKPSTPCQTMLLDGRRLGLIAEDMLGRREPPLADFHRVGGDRGFCSVCEFGVSLNELRSKVAEDS